MNWPPEGAYYSDSHVAVFCGDCREILPQIEFCDLVITDPVWPNCKPELAGSKDPYGLFAEAMGLCQRLTNRFMVILGCDSDPRFLLGVPKIIPFFAAVWAKRVPPNYKGKKIISADVAYVFGDGWKNDTVSGYFSTETYMVSQGHRDKDNDHPVPRQYKEMVSLIGKYTCAGEIILDPFAGSGTTGVAARAAGRRAILIEINEHFCEIAVNRCSQQVLL